LAQISINCDHIPAVFSLLFIIDSIDEILDTVTRLKGFVAGHIDLSFLTLSVFIIFNTNHNDH